MGWKQCCDCGYEMDPDLYPACDVEEYGCPVCGSYCIDEEVVVHGSGAG